MKVILPDRTINFNSATLAVGLGSSIFPRLLLLRTHLPSTEPLPLLWSNITDDMLSDVRVELHNDVIKVISASKFDITSEVDKSFPAFYLPYERDRLTFCLRRPRDVRMEYYLKLLQSLDFVSDCKGIQFNPAAAISDWEWFYGGMRYTAESVPSEVFEPWLWESIRVSLHKLNIQALIVEEACKSNDLWDNKDLLKGFKAANIHLWGNCTLNTP